MNIINFDLGSVLPNSNKHNKYLPARSIRCIICGVADCGKTNLMLNFLFWLKFDKLYVFSRTLFQSKYEILREMFEDIEQELGKKIAFFYNNNEDVPPPEQLFDKNGNTVFVFDDVMTDKQNNIEKYFAQGRHSNVDSFYLCQTFSRIPKRVIRDNANLIILFKQDEMNLKHVYNNHVGTDMSYQEFWDTCKSCWNDENQPYGFLTIDKTKTMNDGRYKNRFDDKFVF
jgi:hypothetical protein